MRDESYYALKVWKEVNKRLIAKGIEPPKTWFEYFWTWEDWHEKAKFSSKDDINERLS